MHRKWRAGEFRSSIENFGYFVEGSFDTIIFFFFNLRSHSVLPILVMQRLENDPPKSACPPIRLIHTYPNPKSAALPSSAKGTKCMKHYAPGSQTQSPTVPKISLMIV